MQGKVFSVEIRPRLPERFKRLEELANDLYFSWNRGIRGFFRHLDEHAWHESGHNPKVFLRRVSQQRLEQAATDPILFAEYRRVLSVYDTYLEERPHTRIDRYLDPERDLVAYFSAEFGFHQSMPIYAGGLGILAADYCKAMSNLWVPFVGVGLLVSQAVGEIIRLPEDHVMGPMVAIGKGTKEPWPKPGQLSLDEIVFENGF